MLKAASIALALAVGCGSPAHAITGAQLLSLPEHYTQGFVWGVVSVYGNLAGHPDYERVSRHRSDCLIQGRVTDDAFVRSVIAHVETNPAAMTMSGHAVVLVVLNEMCGFPDAPR